MECKDCDKYLGLKEELNALKLDLEKMNEKNEVTINGMKDKLFLLEKQDAITNEQVKSIFKILNEIKDSIQIIAINLEEKPSLDDYNKKRMDTMESDLQELKSEDSKTYKHIKLALVTSIITGVFIFLLNKLLIK